MDLRDRIALIIGADDDIGTATVRRFVTEGATVVVDEAVDKVVAEHGRIDILVNAAAAPDRVFDRCRAVSRHMARRRYGKIVNLAWSAGRYRSAWFPTGSSFRSGTAYAADQGAILAFTRELAFELGPDGVHVNAVVPGLIETQEGKQAWEALSETARSYILLESAVGRRGTPDEVAAVICFLASDRSSYVTGTSIDVNGGWWMS